MIIIIKNKPQILILPNSITVKCKDCRRLKAQEQLNMWVKINCKSKKKKLIRSNNKNMHRNKD